MACDRRAVSAPTPARPPLTWRVAPPPAMGRTSFARLAWLNSGRSRADQVPVPPSVRAPSATTMKTRDGAPAWLQAPIRQPPVLEARGHVGARDLVRLPPANARRRAVPPHRR